MAGVPWKEGTSTKHIALCGLRDLMARAPWVEETVWFQHLLSFCPMAFEAKPETSAVR